MSPIALVLSLIAGLFALAGACIAIFGPGSGNPPLQSELWRAYRSTTVIVFAIVAPAFIHPWLFAALVAAAASRCAYELAAIYGGRLSAWPPWLLLGAGAIACVAFGALQPPWAERAFMGASGLALLAAVPVYSQALLRPVPVARRWWAATLFPGLAAAHLSHLVFRGQGAGWVIVLYGTVEAQDSAAYVFGRLFGRHRVFPRLSPRKTLEGLLAGFAVGGAFGALLCHQLVGATWTESAGVAATLIVAGLAGDLFTSRLKRVAGVKDFPPINLVHGGLLDIYDSTLFAVLPLSLLLFALSSLR